MRKHILGVASAVVLSALVACGGSSTSSSDGTEDGGDGGSSGGEAGGGSSSGGSGSSSGTGSSSSGSTGSSGATSGGGDGGGDGGIDATLSDAAVDATAGDAADGGSSGSGGSDGGGDGPTEATLSDAGGDAADGGDAGDDALAPPSIYGIWQGWQGANYQDDAWTVLVGVLDGVADAAPGAVVGVISYPSLGCGGPLTVRAADAGPPADAGFVDDRDGGDASVVARLAFHETDNASCVDGDDYFSLLSDGTLRLEWIDPTGGSAPAVGNLVRSGTVGATEPLVAVWADPSINTNGLRPLLAAVTRTDTVGQAAGVFMLVTDDPSNACGGQWTLTQRNTPTSLGLTESFPQQQIGCSGSYTATLTAIDGGAMYMRSVDGGGGTDAAAYDAAPLTLVRLSP